MSSFRRFETLIAVRPDDIDMNEHVHNSKYFDYVLAARYDQMERCYGMSMQAFLVTWTSHDPIRSGDTSCPLFHNRTSTSWVTSSASSRLVSRYTASVNTLRPWVATAASKSGRLIRIKRRVLD